MKKMGDEKLLLRIEEAAERLSLGRSTVYDAVRRGELASVKIGRSRRIPVSALKDFIAARIAEAMAEDGD